MKDNDELKDILTESELAAVHSQIDLHYRRFEEAAIYGQLRKRVDEAIESELNERAEQLGALRRKAHRLIDRAESISEGSLRILRFLDDKSSV
jgi:hypothetical protein